MEECNGRLDDMTWSGNYAIKTEMVQPLPSFPDPPVAPAGFCFSAADPGSGSGPPPFLRMDANH